MGRLGHDARLWLALGVVAGPASVALVTRALKDHDLVRPARLRWGRRGRGTVDVLVGVDGSPESLAALTAAVDLIGERLGRLTLAAVADFDSGFPGGPDRSREAAEEALARARAIATNRALSPEVIVLFGSPASALEDYARDHGFELLAIGRRGRGLATAAFGSVASDLARTAVTPVLISAPDGAGDDDSAAEDGPSSS